MTDLRLNPYFQNQNIRRLLIRARLINRHGEILRRSSEDISLPSASKGRRTRENLSKVIHNYVTEEEQKRRAVLRSQIDLSAKHVHTNEKRSPKRAKSARHLSRDPENHFVRRSTKEKSPAKSLCRVIMTYYGRQTVIDYDKSWFQQKGDEIIVMQQHCGGENLTVFKGYVKAGDTFAFDSQRHRDYPFALALYINGLIDCRVSVCCEYKHKKNVPLGGPHGAFAISNVQKVQPCRSCQYIQHKKKKSKPTTAPVLASTRYQKSHVPHLPSKDLSHSPVPRPRSNSPLTSTTHKRRSPDIRRTPTPEEDNKKPLISSTAHTSSVVPTDHNFNKQNAAVSRTSQRSSDADDTKLPITSARRVSPVIRTDQSPDVSRTPTPPPPRISTSHVSRKSSTTSEDILDNEKPSVSSTKHNLSTDYTSNIQKPVDSQNNNKDYATDFDEPNDEDYTSTNSRFGRPQISDSNSIDKDQEDYNIQSTSSFKKLSSSTSSDDDYHQTKKLNGKENIIDHSRRSSSSISRKSGPTEDKDNNHLLQILSETNNVADDSRRSSSSTSRKSGPSPTDQIKRELNEKNTSNRFSTTTTSKKDNEGDRRLSMSPSDDIFGTKHSSSAKKNEDIQYSSKVRRTSSNSSEDFLGIKRTSKETNQNNQILTKDWFETDSKNDLGDSDLYAPPKTKSWRTNIFSDEDN